MNFLHIFSFILVVNKNIVLISKSLSQQDIFFGIGAIFLVEAVSDILKNFFYGHNIFLKKIV
jgi:hypothetical protein